MKLALRINVDTWRGTQQGVPTLLDLLEKHGAQATFLFSLGPDHTGRAFAQLLRSGRRRPSWHTQARGRYGLRSLAYGTVLPGPEIGKRGATILQDVAARGFDVANHGWNRVHWLRHVAQADAAWTERDMRRSQKRFAEIFGRDAPGHGAAGWQMNADALRLTQRLGYAWSSDCRGTHPFVPVWRGEPIHCPQLPTTLPTLGEIASSGEYPREQMHNALLRASADPRATGHVYTLHAELEGMAYADVFEQALTGWKEQGYELVSLSDLFASLDMASLPRHEIIRGTLPGRQSTLMLQGEEFLSTWKDMA